MKLEVKIELLKFCSDVFNCILLALGLSLVGCAVWILFDRGNFLNVLPSDELRTVGVGLLMIGGVVMVVSILGCLGARRENRFLLLVYMTFIIVLALGQLFVTLLLLISGDKIAESLGNVVNQIIQEYPDADNGQDRLLDNIQRYGCKTQLSDWLAENSLTIVGMDISLILVQVVQFTIAVHLYQAFSKKASLKRTPPQSDDDQNLDYGEQNYAYTDSNQPAMYQDDAGYIDPDHYQN